MPKLDAFPTHMMAFVKQVISAGGDSVRTGTQAGADFMREYIAGGSPTGSDWHDLKNSLNGYPNGSRIGGRVETAAGGKLFFRDPHAGQMLKSVGISDLVLTKQISQNYGWVKDPQQYFLLQDTGDYARTAVGNPTGMGMGLLNAASGSGKDTVHQLGAYNEANNKFIEKMKSHGFGTN